MKFEEAVKEMQKGKIGNVGEYNCKFMDGILYIRKFPDNDYYAPNITKQFVEQLINRTDWEIKDWNLAEQEEPQLSGTKFNALFIEDIKKCRDLILEDIYITPIKCDNGAQITLHIENVIKPIINKRFGELK